MKIGGQDIISNKGLELLESLFKSSGEGIMLFNKDGEVVMANPRAREMFGYDEGEVLGQKVEKFVPKQAQKKHQGYRKEYINHPEPRRMGIGRDLSGLRKDGSTFPLEISLSYMQHNNEKLVVAFITDISIRKENEKKLEEQRKKLEEYTSELEQKVKARTSELEHMNLGLQSQIQERKLAEEALKQSLEDLKKAEQEILKSLEKEKELGELKSRFVSMASHEFRTPLTTVLSSANLIGKYTETDQQEAREKHINRIKKSVQNLTNILNDFLSLEKLESGAQKVNFNKMDVNELLQEIVEEMSQSVKNGQEIFLSGTAPAIQTDEHILKNILLNLISNASKYSSEGDKIEINIEHDKHLKIHIVDHGIGIPKSEQKKMFDRFFRAANATNIQGTGLGLNIVKKYADLLKGGISFTSTEGQGSTFTLSLPLS
ncbi:PAS domain-containing sensor histidine kinase [Ekhidna sp.]|jgi:PAS domain S-box-containing protein|uniref:PAS domain-containing sensor histidine kinase n=1 Tax=Ekhidna sp. TaxID=2608089 RepID=UPI0032F00DB6